MNTQALALRHRQSGFTLAELAISVVIIGLLIGGLLGPIGRQVDQGRINETQKQLEFAREALLGFAIINQRLPCPDRNGDGLEEATCAPVNQPLVGALPWATLGLLQSDAWGNRFRYAVTPDLAVGPIGWASTGGLTVTQRDPSTKTALPLTTTAAAVVLSFGKNGFGGTLADGTVAGVARTVVPAINSDETANAFTTAIPPHPATMSFASRTPIDASTPCSDTVGVAPLCEFDDQLVWLSLPVLVNRMTTAGRIP